MTITKKIREAINDMVLNPHRLKQRPSELKRKCTAYKELTIDEIIFVKNQVRPEDSDLKKEEEPKIKTVAMEVDIVERKHKAIYKDLKSKYDRLLQNHEVLEDSYNDLLVIQENKKPINIPLTKETKDGRSGASLILVSDWHVEKQIIPSSVNGMNEYNLDIAKQRAEKFTDSTIKLINRDAKDFANHTSVIYLLGDFIEGYLHEHNNTTNYLTPVEATMYAKELLSNSLNTIFSNAKSQNFKVICKTGNHCIDSETEVLTHHGWVSSLNLNIGSEIMAFNKEDGSIHNTIVDQYSTFLNSDNYLVTSKHKNELITSGHNLVVNNGFLKVSDAFNNNMLLTNKDFRLAGTTSENMFRVSSDDIIRFITHIVTDGTIVHKSKYNVIDKTKNSWRIQFKLSKERKIQRLQEVLNALEIPYTLKKATKSNSNVLQPYYIRVYGEIARHYCEDILNSKKEFPDFFRNLSESQLKVLIDELSITDGTIRKYGIEWSSTSKHDVDIVQEACIKNNVECRFTKSEEKNKSGFKNVKFRYTSSIYTGENLHHFHKVTIEKVNTEATFVQIANEYGTLITRRNGVVNFTGNSRMTKKMNSSIDHRHNYEYMLYQMLSKQFPGVDFNVPESDIGYTDILGYTVRDFHGWQLSYGGGIGGLTIPLTKFIQRQNSVKKADFNVFGHFHQFSKPTKDSMLNSSLCGYDTYAQTIGASYEPAQQGYQLLDSKYGFTISAPIICE